MLIFVSLLLAIFALPFGLLPSVLLFRGLANGTDGSNASKKLYAISVWTGLLVIYGTAAWAIHMVVFGLAS